MSTVLQTERVCLRHFAPDDEAAMYEVFADPYARRFYPRMIERAEVGRWIEWNLCNYAEHGFGLWALELADAPGVLIGDCGLTYQDVEGERELEIGYHVHAAHRRRGYATEAARACLDHAFAVVGVDLVCSIVRPANLASRAVAARVHRRSRYVVRKRRPAVVHSTFRAEWLSLR